MNNIIFVSSAYTHGDKQENVIRQIKAFHVLRDKGWAPFIPLLSHYLDAYRFRPYEDWMDFCFSYVGVSSALCRIALDIPSSGADREESKARMMGIPVFYEENSVPEFKEFKKMYKVGDFLIKEESGVVAIAVISSVWHKLKIYDLDVINSQGKKYEVKDKEDWELKDDCWMSLGEYYAAKYQA